MATLGVGPCSREVTVFGRLPSFRMGLLLRDESTARLTGIGTWVLRDLSGGETPERVVSKLVTAYRVDPGAARRDVAAVAERLRLARYLPEG